MQVFMDFEAYTCIMGVLHHSYIANVPTLRHGLRNTPCYRQLYISHGVIIRYLLGKSLLVFQGSGPESTTNQTNPLLQKDTHIQWFLGDSTTQLYIQMSKAMVIGQYGG